MLCLVQLLLLMIRGAAQVQVIYFLSPTCKICQFYTLEMRELYDQYDPQQVGFSAFAPGSLVTDSSLIAFQSTYRLPFPVVKDDFLHRQMNATVTPEVFVIYRDELVYHGRIDDSFVRVGKRRAQLKNRELRATLDALLAGHIPDIHYAPPVGCIIEK
jgi:hypothetical protein